MYIFLHLQLAEHITLTLAESKILLSKETRGGRTKTSDWLVPPPLLSD